ncbi:MAG: D-sedoheptulose 7-phosphate isomerase [bacterium]|nr:D-sedoheptulose 7-phosphate isomerase [bacterium]MDT8395654.1 D-sedoheptulose 7-phosphate isomerase [bacterium]
MKRFEELIIQRGAEAADLIENFCTDRAKTVARIAETMIKSILSGGKILVIGNGGSAADAQHFAAELVNRFLMERRPLPALALTTNSSNLTSIANDYSFEQVFSKQVEALGREGDVLLALTTSGASANVLKALERANAQSMATVSLTGPDCSRLDPLCDICLTVPDRSTPRIQEVHHLVLHLVAEIMEIALFAHGS